MSNTSQKGRVDVELASSVNVDKRRWFTLLLQIIIGSVTAYIYCVNIYIGPMAEQYGWNPQIVVLAFSLSTATGVVASIVGGSLRDRFGNKWCLKFGGLGFGICVILSALKVSVWFFVIGQGIGATFFMYIVYVSQMANIGELFPDRKGMAIGIGIGGINLGSALIVPLSEWLLRFMGISPSIALQGIVYGGLTIVCGFLVTEAPKGYKPAGWTPKFNEKELQEDHDDGGLTWKQSIKTAGFWLLSASFALAAVIIMGLSSNLSLIAQDCLGVSTSKAAWLYTVFALFGGVGGFIFGSIGDKFGSLRSFVCCLFITAVAIIAGCFIGFDSFALFVIVIASWTGLVMGGYQTLVVASLMDGFGNKNFGINFGICGVLTAAGTFYGANISVSMASEDFLMIGAICAALGGVIGIITIILVNKMRGKKVL